MLIFYIISMSILVVCFIAVLKKFFDKKDEEVIIEENNIYKTIGFNGISFNEKNKEFIFNPMVMLEPIMFEEEIIKYTNNINNKLNLDKEREIIIVTDKGFTETKDLKLVYRNKRRKVDDILILNYKVNDSIEFEENLNYMKKIKQALVYHKEATSRWFDDYSEKNNEEGFNVESIEGIDVCE